jgi:hypothetical protein
MDYQHKYEKYKRKYQMRKKHQHGGGDPVVHIVHGEWDADWLTEQHGEAIEHIESIEDSSDIVYRVTYLNGDDVYAIPYPTCISKSFMFIKPIDKWVVYVYDDNIYSDETMPFHTGVNFRETWKRSLNKTIQKQAIELLDITSQTELCKQLQTKIDAHLQEQKDSAQIVPRITKPYTKESVWEYLKKLPSSPTFKKLDKDKKVVGCQRELINVDDDMVYMGQYYATGIIIKLCVDYTESYIYINIDAVSPNTYIRNSMDEFINEIISRNIDEVPTKIYYNNADSKRKMTDILRQFTITAPDKKTTPPKPDTPSAQSAPPKPATPVAVHMTYTKEYVLHLLQKLRIDDTYKSYTDCHDPIICVDNSSYDEMGYEKTCKIKLCIDGTDTYVLILIDSEYLDNDVYKQITKKSITEFIDEMSHKYTGQPPSTIYYDSYPTRVKMSKLIEQFEITDSPKSAKPATPAPPKPATPSAPPKPATSASPKPEPPKSATPVAVQTYSQKRVSKIITALKRSPIQIDAHAIEHISGVYIKGVHEKCSGCIFNYGYSMHYSKTYIAFKFPENTDYQYDAIIKSFIMKFENAVSKLPATFDIRAHDEFSKEMFAKVIPHIN